METSHQDVSPARRARSPRRIVVAIALVLVAATGAAATVAGVVRLLDHAEAATTRATLESPRVFAVSPEQVGPSPAPLAERLDPGTLSTPAAGLRVPLVSLGLDANGDFALPRADQAAVFADGAPLAADTGSTFIAGHVVDAAGRFAPMARLSTLRPGDRIVTVDDSGSRRHWYVVAAQVVPRDGLDPAMWATTGSRQLVLVTCAGRVDVSVGAVTSFTENLVVTTVPVT